MPDLQSDAWKKKKLYPAATPNASSTYRPAKRMKGDEIGRYVAISDMHKAIVYTTGHLLVVNIRLPQC